MIPISSRQSNSISLFLSHILSSHLPVPFSNSFYSNRYGCYDKPFLTSLVGARTKEMIHISFRLAVTHCGSLSINFPLLPFCLLSLVVVLLYLAQINRCRYYVKPSLTSLWLNRFARWLPQIPSPRINLILCRSLLCDDAQIDSDLCSLSRLMSNVVSLTINFPQHPSGLIALKDDNSPHFFSE